MVFVCSANSARSQLAAAAWNSVSSIPAASAGTHPARRVHPRAVKVARQHGLDLANATPASIEDVLRGGELIVAVCNNAHEELDADAAATALVDPRPGPARYGGSVRRRLHRHHPTREHLADRQPDTGKAVRGRLHGSGRPA